MNVTTANTYDIPPKILKENGFKPYKVVVTRTSGEVKEITLQGRDSSDIWSFMDKHWGCDVKYTAEPLI